MARRSKYYVALSQEQIKRAQHTDIAEFLLSRGEELHKEGNFWVWDKYDSVRIQDYKWIRNSTKEGGAAVFFLQYFFDMHFVEAVQTLTNDASLPYIEAKAQSKVYTKKELILPMKNDTSHRAIAYLTKTRCLDPDIVAYFMDNGSIYEDYQHNVVFVGYDGEGKPKSAFKRGTLTCVDKSYKRLEVNSSATHPFAHYGNSNVLCVFEASIDLLSFICINRHMDWRQYSYIAMGGLNTAPIDYALSRDDRIKHIVLCFDSDAPGREAASRFTEKYRDKGYTVSTRFPANKDWNEDLKEMRCNK